MTIAEWMIFAAVILYLLTVAPVKAVGYRTFDNSNPRDPGFYKPGIGSRALGAHLNGIETFPFFAVAVLLAEFRHGPQYWIDGLAVAFAGVRLLFVAAYLSNWPTTRTLLWNLGFTINTALFFMPWWANRVVRWI
ncbi:MAG TPA: MAPEG family protein [Usitatibacter sp.]|nr:MAPEG family protein [Usitatibacter sp.]